MTQGWAYYSYPKLPVGLHWHGPDAFTLYRKVDDIGYACNVNPATRRDLAMLQDCFDPLFDDQLRGLHRLISSHEPKIGWVNCGRDRNRRGY